MAETLGGLLPSGITVLGQNNLTESLWNNIAALDSSAGLTGVLSAIRATPGSSAFKSGLDLLSTSDFQPSPIDQVANQGTPTTKILENDSLFLQPSPRSIAAASLSNRVRGASEDPLTGMAEGAPFVSAQAVYTIINFQPATSAVPEGYIKDTGEAYSETRGFGWVREDSLGRPRHVPLDITSNTRDRKRAGVDDQRLDTLIYMQGNHVRNFKGVRIPAAWEYALPKGHYSVSVSVGDQPNSKGLYDSIHKINVEGKTAIQPFQSNSIHEYERGMAQVNVTDGRLTISAIGGTNTKLNYIKIKSVAPGEHPRITGSSPMSRQIGINRNAAVNLDVRLISAGAGVDGATLNADNVRLYHTKTHKLVAGNINTTGGGDAIVYQPKQLLTANTHYTLWLGSGVKDEAGRDFLPFSTTFSTGTTIDVPPTPGVKFNKLQVYSGAPSSSLVVSPGGSKLYAAGLDGRLRRWTIGSSGALTNLQTLSLPQLAGRAIIGTAFDPRDPNVIWICHNNPLFPQPAKDFTGKISKLTLQSGPGFKASIQDYVIGLPRSAKDHMSNSLAFHKGMLYMTQGSNSATGDPSKAWDFREERLLSAAVLQIDPQRTAPAGGFNVQTETREAANYNPYATNAPVTIYATGVRNAYDLVWHSNGSLYVPTNGSSAGGSTPDDPRTRTKDEKLTNVVIQNDYLFRVVKGGYYGHPNPQRNEYILNGGNPTSGKDLAEVVPKRETMNGGVLYREGYSIGTNPDPNYKGFVYDFGRNRSPNGVIEYRSNTFGGVLKNQLLVVEYSGGDRILALKPKINGNVTKTGVTQIASGFTKPLDLIENTRNGNLYITELIDETGQGQISLLKPA